MINKQIKKCIVCGGIIHICSNKDSIKLRRSIKSLTCSKKCSKTYSRIIEKFCKKITYKNRIIKQLERKIIELKGGIVK